MQNTLYFSEESKLKNLYDDIKKQQNFRDRKQVSGYEMFEIVRRHDYEQLLRSDRKFPYTYYSAYG